MKKLILFFILLALSISLFGCEKAPPCDVTIDEPFSDFEVVVSFTLEESAKDKEYTPSDFAAVDCFNVYPFDYYPEEIHHEYAGRKTVILMLSEQSKQGVLDAVALLQKDDRIYSAEPNFIPVELYGICYVVLAEKEAQKNLTYSNDSFENCNMQCNGAPNKFTKNSYNLPRDERILTMLYTKGDFEALKKLAQDERVKYVIHTIPLSTNRVDFYVTMKQINEYTVGDFDYIDCVEVSTYVDMFNVNMLIIKIEDKGYRNYFTKYNMLLNDERIEKAKYNPPNIIVKT